MLDVEDDAVELVVETTTTSDLNLSPFSLYHVNVSSRNEGGDSAPMSVTVETTPQRMYIDKIRLLFTINVSLYFFTYVTRGVFSNIFQHKHQTKR